MANSQAIQTTDNSYKDYWFWQRDSSPDLIARYPNLDLKGKDVLDIGCGIGGRTCYLGGQGARHVVGCDINSREIETTENLKRELAPELKDKVVFSCNQTEQIGLGKIKFDLVLIIDAMEYIKEPSLMPEQAYRLLKPGGKLNFGAVGWGHWHATHMLRIFPVSFMRLFFSDKTILNTARRMMKQEFYKSRTWDSNPPCLR
ncbi:class I SAM-dependent methyltransferase [Dethiosulfatarculus sandiegensis]|uniref:Methyltransferase type 11 domain-containing protein n=1 Tax=Dethiosulfatarculus sandiegensis TaxID=1429043 RepID=A0A0D2JFY9_9BACT|nr:class I SAM-dependent methyltransferase [Dethiosulfatarculus sandiegensis]KIX14616.1 hypothetical protein X474_07610 [Dethiosulfatarculus sandiegensis]